MKRKKLFERWYSCRQMNPNFYNESGGSPPAFNDNSIMTVVEVAKELRCSKAHVCNAINGKLNGVTPLPAISLGRRKLVRRSTFAAWLAENDPGETATIGQSPERGRKSV
jgi:hypothetical protein